MTFGDQYRTTFFLPMRDLVDCTVLEQSNVLIFGCGAMGDCISETLARMAVGRMTFWDYDVVEIRNLARTLYTMRDLGLRKSDACVQHARTINPMVKATGIHGDILQVPSSVIITLAHQHSVVIVAADDIAVHRKINRLLWPVLPCLYTYLTHSGDVGEIVWTSPGEPGCLECLGNLAQRAAAGVTHDFQALGIDMLQTASCAVRVVLGLILRNAKGGSLFGDFVSPSSHLLLVFTRRRGVFAEAAPTDFVSGTVRVDTRTASRDCPVCKPK